MIASNYTLTCTYILIKEVLFLCIADLPHDALIASSCFKDWLVGWFSNEAVLRSS